MTTENIPFPQQMTPEFKQHVAVLNARITNVNLALNNLLREMDNTFKAVATTIAELQKENTRLKK